MDRTLSVRTHPDLLGADCVSLASLTGMSVQSALCEPLIPLVGGNRVEGYSSFT